SFGSQFVVQHLRYGQGRLWALDAVPHPATKSHACQEYGARGAHVCNLPYGSPGPARDRSRAHRHARRRDRGLSQSVDRTTWGGEFTLGVLAQAHRYDPGEFPHGFERCRLRLAPGNPADGEHHWNCDPGYRVLESPLASACSESGRPGGLLKALLVSAEQGRRLRARSFGGDRHGVGSVKRSSLSCARPSCFDGGSDTATGTEDAFHDCPLRPGCANHVSQHLVDNVFLKDPEIPVFE